MKKTDKILLGIIGVLILLLTMMVVVGIRSAQADTPFICMVTKGEWVWLRSAPDKDAEKIGTIRYGVEGEIHGITNGYADITTLDGRKGYADVSYLEIPIKEEIWVVNTEGPLNKRETPDGRYLGRIKGGARISVLGWRYSKSGELWAKVFRGGYVKAEYLSKTE